MNRLVTFHWFLTDFILHPIAFCFYWHFKLHCKFWPCSASCRFFTLSLETNRQKSLSRNKSLLLSTSVKWIYIPRPSSLSHPVQQTLNPIVSVCCVPVCTPGDVLTFMSCIRISIDSRITISIHTNISISSVIWAQCPSEELTVFISAYNSRLWSTETQIYLFKSHNCITIKSTQPFKPLKWGSSTTICF